MARARRTWTSAIIREPLTRVGTIPNVVVNSMFREMPSRSSCASALVVRRPPGGASTGRDEEVYLIAPEPSGVINGRVRNSHADAGRIDGQPRSQRFEQND